MEKKEVLLKVIEVISAATGIKTEVIEPQSTIFDELGIDSIDMLDVLFTLEMDFDVSLKVSDLENAAREEMQGVPFEVDGIITVDGLDVLKKKMPEIPPEKLHDGMTMNDIFGMINVETLCNMVMYKLNTKDPSE